MVTIIFGAGASWGSGGCSPQNPPLGKDLFAHLENLNGSFTKLSSELKSNFEGGDFEAGMASIPNDSRILNPLQKELACYLSSFKIEKDNAYIRLFDKLRTVINNLQIVTLNYDLLIEQALSYHKHQIDYNGINQGITLLKPHGSSNFLPQIPTGMFIQGSVMRNCSSYFEGFKTTAAGSQQEIIDWCSDHQNNDLSPVLAVYAKGKHILINPKLIETIQKKYSDLVKKSSLVVLVGVRYTEHDAHLWSPILESAAQLLIVDPFPENTIAWAQKNNINNFTVFSCSFEKSIWEMTKLIKSKILNY